METIYWIQRLGAMSDLITFCFVLSIVAAIIGILFRVIELGYYADDEAIRKWRKYMRLNTFALVFFTLLYIFVPSEKDLYVIYGIGGTIDYIKSNDTAKQLPDKVVNALDAWLDKQTEN